jgi:hypothetical protein
MRGFLCASVLVLATVGALARASTLSDAAAALWPGQWTVVNTSNLNRATPDDGAGYHVLYYTEDLSPTRRATSGRRTPS